MIRNLAIDSVSATATEANDSAEKTLDDVKGQTESKTQESVDKLLN